MRRPSLGRGLGAKLLVDIPRRMHWNAFRLCIGPPPQQWLDVADEAGLLLQYESPIWIWKQSRFLKHWKEEEVIAQFKEFVRDNWNHPSVAIWDASNETFWPELRTKVDPGGPRAGPFQPPLGKRLQRSARARRPLRGPSLFSPRPQEAAPVPVGRDGNPRRVAEADRHAHELARLHHQRVRHALSASRRAADPRLAEGVRLPAWARRQRPSNVSRSSAYALAGLTEYWRAHRNYAGVMYLAYLDGDVRDAVTCDNFRDIRRLALDPYFADYVGEAFKPLGVYVNFWQPQLPAGAKRSCRVMMVNDAYEPARGRLNLVWQSAAGGRAAGRAERAFDIPALGQAAYDLELTTPAEAGQYELKAEAFWDGKPWSPTVSRRNVAVK